MYKLKDITEEFKDFIESYIERDASHFSRLSPIENCDENSLIFALNEKLLITALQSKAAILITKPKFAKLCEASNKSIIYSFFPDLLSTKILQKYFYKNPWQDLKSYGVHPKASVHSSVSVPKNSFVGAFSVIGENSKIGEQVYIGENVVIEANVSIANNSIIHSLCYIHTQSEIGTFCTLRSGTVIGATPLEGVINKTPSTAKCIIEDQVETGSNTCIDRGIHNETRIRFGTKIDNLVKISAGVDIGEMSLITAGVQIGESAKIGSHFMIGGNSYVDAFVEICPKVIVGGMSFVDQNIDKAGAYGGNPVQEMRDYLKTTASLAALPKIRKQLSKLNE